MKKYLFIIVPISIIFYATAWSQNDSIDIYHLLSKDKTRLFDSDELVEITLRFDIANFKKTKFKDEYQDALMTYFNGKDTVARNIQLKARGQFRRSYCDFPPVRMNLKRNEYPDDKFNGIDKVKLVTHCNAGGNENVLKEYLVYKLFNVLTDISFRVKLLKINYINSKKPKRPFVANAFMIEPIELLTERTKSLEVTSEKLSQKNIKPEIMDRIAIFNYMIGNYDWTVPRTRNLVIFSQPDSEEPSLGLLAPYDFDYSGLVNTDYAIPPEALPIKSVRDRLYLGVCRSEDEFRNSLCTFLDKKAALYKVINDFPYLKDKSKKDMTTFLDGFFRGFDKHSTIVYKLLSECRDF